MQNILTNLLPFLRQSQLKTLTKITTAALKSSFSSLSQLARSIKSHAKPRHKIKQLDRFLSNPHISIHKIQQTLASFIVPSNEPFVIAVDWTEIRGFMCLVAGRISKGRALPFCLLTYPKGNPPLCQNELEENFLHILKNTLPSSSNLPYIITADRGFGYRQLLGCLLRLGMKFVIRIRGTLRVRHKGQFITLREIFSNSRPPCKVRRVLLNDEMPFLNLVYGYERGAKEPWYLVTNLDRTAYEIVDIYKKRMRIEETFRDIKWARGIADLGELKMKREYNLNMLLTVMMVVYFVVYLSGISARRRGVDKNYISNGRGNRLSIVFIGRCYLLERWRSIGSIFREGIALLEVDSK